MKEVVDKVEDDNCQKQEKEILAGLVQGLRIFDMGWRLLRNMWNSPDPLDP